MVTVGVLMSEVERKIRECVMEFELYRPYAPTEVDQVINSLKEIGNLISDLDSKKMEKALGMVIELYRRLEGKWYSDYIRTTINNLDFTREWLEKAIQ